MPDFLISGAGRPASGGARARVDLAATALIPQFLQSRPYGLLLECEAASDSRYHQLRLYLTGLSRLLAACNDALLAQGRRLIVAFDESEHIDRKIEICRSLAR